MEVEYIWRVSVLAPVVAAMVAATSQPSFCSCSSSYSSAATKRQQSVSRVCITIKVTGCFAM